MLTNLPKPALLAAAQYLNPAYSNRHSAKTLAAFIEKEATDDPKRFDRFRALRRARVAQSIAHAATLRLIREA